MEYNYQSDSPFPTPYVIHFFALNFIKAAT